MASSSTSSIPKSFTYDVFLSFRGEDTRKNFVDHLYHALEREDIYTFKDDKNMEKGERISIELIKAIEDSRFHIIVFSKNYASSSWCLDELVKIMECQKTAEQTAYPIFYDVEPSEVRKQSGAVGEAFSRHRNNVDAGKWRNALEDAAGLSGWELKNVADGHEFPFIQIIVGEISQKLPSVNSSLDENLVGMVSRINDVVSSLEIGLDDVRMIGIKGIGGGGKTTLARAVFDQISYQFEGKSFVENVREVSNSSLSGLKSLQEQILSNVLNEGITVSGIHDGKMMMKKKLRRRKVFVVLDDVDLLEQLEALAGEPSWFKSGSRIIITTRDEQVLIAHGVKWIHDVNLLSDEEAFCLFNRFAFRGELPIPRYKELSQQVVRYAAGLPLTIRVLGSDLKGKDELEWKDTLERLKTIPPKETLKQLELSYMGLEPDHKNIFLDVACFWKDEPKDKAIRVLEICQLHARAGLRVLERKSLITVSEYGYLRMHDSIQDMGRDIVRREHPNEPYKHSRLWIDEEIENILANDLGTEATSGIKLWSLELSPSIIVKGLKNMKNLRFLHVDTSSAFCMDYSDGSHRDGIIDEVSQYFPNSLQYLSWYWYPFSSLPITSQANNLVGLYMVNSNSIQLWEGGERKVLKKLRFFEFSKSCFKTLDLGFTPNLETLSIKDCHSLEKLHMPIECLKIKSLDISNAKLTTLDLEGTLNLETLNLERCYDLVELHLPTECLKLKSLDIKYSKLTTLDLGWSPKLETLSLVECIDLEELHMPVECLELRTLDIWGSKLSTVDLGRTLNLETLSLVECVDLKELHMPVECPELRTLDIRGSKLRTFDLGWTPNLETLSLLECRDLEELHMTVECLKLKSLNIGHSQLRTLDLGRTPNLEWLCLTKCFHLVKLHAPVGCLKELVYLDLGSGCSRFKSFLFKKLFKSLEVGSLNESHLVAEFVDMCPLHYRNNLPKLWFECFYEEDLPSSIGNLEKFIDAAGLCACANLKTFSRFICGLRVRKLTLDGSILEATKDLDQLQRLDELILSSTEIKHLPDNICTLKHLKSLELKSCWYLEKLPDDLTQFECLEKLTVMDCISLRHVPDSICKMKCLKYLHLTCCILVVKLPEEIGRLQCLKELNIEGTGITHLPQSIFLLKGLRIVGFRWLLELCGFTSEIKTSEHETFCYI